MTLQTAPYTYAMTARPVGIGCQPDRHIAYEDREKRGTGVWGILGYDRPLTEQEVTRYELRPVTVCICGSIAPLTELPGTWSVCPDCGTN